MMGKRNLDASPEDLRETLRGDLTHFKKILKLPHDKMAGSGFALWYLMCLLRGGNTTIQRML